MVSNLWKYYGRGNNCAVLLYHRICPEGGGAGYDKGVSVTPAAFRRQIQYLAAHYRPISLATLIEGLTGVRPLPRRAIHITFDDGYEDVYRYALPIMLRYKIPATVFVSVDMVETDRRFWWDELGELIRDFRGTQLCIESGGRSLHLDLKNEKSKSRSFALLVGLVSDGEISLNEFRDRVVSRVDRPTGKRVSNTLSWSQIAEMAANSIEIGSHTLSHARLSALNDHDLEEEITESKQLLESSLQAKVSSIAYPYGRESDYDSRAVIGSCLGGYRIAFTGVQGLARPGINVFAVPRVPIRGTDTMGVFKAKVSGSFPILYSLCRRFLGLSHGC
jgi:peptidoglycan/xylan/chitin deacetylase (PgdA/CDA1 family)